MDVQTIVGRIRQQGFCFLDPFSSREIGLINDYLLALPVYRDAHVAQTSRHLGRVSRDLAQDSAAVCVEMHDVIRAPLLLEYGMALGGVAATYLQVRRPVAYSMNAFWTRPGAGPTRPDIQEFHVDADDRVFLAMFVYLTDVESEEDGPQDLRGPDDRVRSIYGQAGTVFIADTSLPHRGRKPTSHERGLAWFRWGVSPVPPAYKWDCNTPLPAAEIGDRYPASADMREAIKLIVSP